MGRCRSFDAEGDGYGRGEGWLVIVLREHATVPKADTSNTPALAFVSGCAVNQDGRSSGLTAPYGPAQTLLIKEALQAGELSPDSIYLVSVHGTGTPLGDPIEVRHTTT